jgi:hypothetical protein
MFDRIHVAYDRIGDLLELGRQPPPPRRRTSMVVVPVATVSRLTAEAISTALSMGDEVTAVTVCYADPEDEAVDAAFRGKWEAWHPNVPLVTVHAQHRSLAPPIVKYLKQLEAEDRHDRLLVLIPEVRPAHRWQWILHNQRGGVLQRAIQRDTVNIVICRLRYQLSTVAAGQPAGVGTSPPGTP